MSPMIVSRVSKCLIKETGSWLLLFCSVNCTISFVHDWGFGEMQSSLKCVISCWPLRSVNVEKCQYIQKILLLQKGYDLQIKRKIYWSVSSLQNIKLKHKTRDVKEGITFSVFPFSLSLRTTDPFFLHQLLIILLPRCWAKYKMMYKCIINKIKLMSFYWACTNNNSIWIQF